MMEELEELEVDLAAGHVDAAEIPESYTVLRDASRQQIRKWLQDCTMSVGIRQIGLSLSTWSVRRQSLL